MSGEGCRIFCETLHAGRILGVNGERVEAWITGGYLSGTYSDGRWLADIRTVLRRHIEHVRNGRLERRKSGSDFDGSEVCDEIAELNIATTDAVHTPKLARKKRKLSGYIAGICVCAVPDRRPVTHPRPKRKKVRIKKDSLRKGHGLPTPKERSGRPARPAATGYRTRSAAEDREETRRKNGRAYESFKKNRANRFGDGPLPSIAHKRFWWNEE